MAPAASEYSQYFKEDTQVKVGIKLADGRLLDVSGLVRFIEKDRLTLEMIGDDVSGQMEATEGSAVFITFWTGWSLCRCNAVLSQKIYGRRIFLRLTGQVIEKQTRDYFRLDVSMPISCSLPETQHIAEVHETWLNDLSVLKERPAPVMAPGRDGFKVVRWDGLVEILPQQVNLSGGGIRFRSGEFIKPESLVMLDLFLPLVPSRVVHVVAETLRCNEIVLGREKGQSFITAARFHFISEKDRESIISFIFSEQRRILNSYAGKRL